MRILGLAVLLMLTGCRDGSRGPGKKETPTERGDAIARVAAIQRELADVRHLKLLNPVAAQQQSTAEFTAFVHRKLDAEAKLVADQTTAMVALGLLPAGTDLTSAVENTLATQAAAYYDHEAKKVFVVALPQNDQMVDFLVAHELTHALQDQHFGLAKVFAPTDDDGQLNSDALNARRYIVEGDAMFAAILYGVYAKTRMTELHGAELNAVRKYLAQLASMSVSDMAKTLREQASTAATLDPSLKKSLDAIDTLSPAVLVPFVDPYIKGALLALEAYDRGGWKAIDALYRDPPASTEQVLHPTDRLLGARDRPQRVSLPAFRGYEVISSDVLGELQWSIYFQLWGQGERSAAVNWDGDRYVVLRGKDGKLTVLIATIWDGPYDAQLFADSYKASLEARFPGEPVNIKRARRWIVVENDRVFLFDGSDTTLLDTLVSQSSFTAVK